MKLDDRLIYELAEALRLIGFEAQRIEDDMPGGEGVDAYMDISTPELVVKLAIEVKSSGFPRDIKAALYGMQRFMGSNAMPVIPVILAPIISPGARDVLKEHRVGYFDRSGSLYLSGRGIHIQIDKPPTKKQTRIASAIFVGRRAQVIHAAWVSDEEWFGVHELAERSGASAATASQTLIALEQQDFAESRGSGPAKQRRLKDRRALLDAWSEQRTRAKPLPLQRYYAPQISPGAIAAALDEACRSLDTRYEVTGAAAGNIHAPHLTTVSRLECRLPPIMADAVMDRVGARRVQEGWNVGVIEAGSDIDFAFTERHHGFCIADPLQCYLDLLQGGGRSKELAAHLREVCLRV